MSLAGTPMALDHSILINLLIKHIFSYLPRMVLFLSQELLGMCLIGFMGVLERCKFCPTTWRNTARRSKMFLFDL